MTVTLRKLAFLAIIPFLLVGTATRSFAADPSSEGLPLFWWKEGPFVNFGDLLSLKLVARMTGSPIRFYNRKPCHNEKKLLASGSIFFFANNNDVVWGSGINGKTLHKKYYDFTHLDIRAVRGPLTRQFLMENFGIRCPEIYGDPALLIPYFFPELKRKEKPSLEYLVIPHYVEQHLFSKIPSQNIVYSTESWDQIIGKILDSKLVIATSLHGIVVAEAFGIPARLLRLTENNHIFKYNDYYFGTNRPYFEIATSVEEALEMGGEPPFECDLKKLYEAFPFEFWPNTKFKTSTKLGIK